MALHGYTQLYPGHVPHEASYQADGRELYSEVSKTFGAQDFQKIDKSVKSKNVYL